MGKTKVINKDIFERNAGIYKLMANGKRLEILDLLGTREMTVTELVNAMKIRKANVSQHLALLRYLRFVKVKRVGKNAFYSLADPKITKSFQIMNDLLKNNRFS
jgi:ArsR family transcriptional regulator